MSLDYLKARYEQVKHPLAKKLLNLACQKQTNLCLSLDVTTTKDFIKIAEQLGPYIVMLKTHIDIIDDFTPDFLEIIKKIAKKHEFLLFEDRKFADIGNTAQLQYAQGIYKIAAWADFITVHALPGAGMLEGLKVVGQSLDRASLMLVQMSSEGNLLTKEYQQKAIQMSQEHADFVAGFITQERFVGSEEFLYCTPGISLTAKNDATGQQYKTPEMAIRQGSDILIVGRGLYQAEDKVAEVQKYLKAITNHNV